MVFMFGSMILRTAMLCPTLYEPFLAKIQLKDGVSEPTCFADYSVPALNEVKTPANIELTLR